MTEEQIKLFKDTFLAMILDQMHSNIYISDTETDEILYMNQTMKKAFGLEDPEEVLLEGPGEGDGTAVRILPHRPSEKGEEGNESSWRENNALTGRSYQNYDSLLRWNGRIYHIQNSVDVTEYDKMFYSARMDELTQMLNRRGGNERLVQTIEQAERENQILTLVLYDINELKRVNDQYGHSAGDALLRYVASITKEGLGRLDFMFRLSGDEFVMLFYGRSKAEVEESMKRILLRARQDRERLDVDYGVPFSYGLTEIYPGKTVPLMR